MPSSQDSPSSGVIIGTLLCTAVVIICFLVFWWWFRKSRQIHDAGEHDIESFQHPDTEEKSPVALVHDPVGAASSSGNASAQQGMENQPAFRTSMSPAPSWTTPASRRESDVDLRPPPLTLRDRRSSNWTVVRANPSPGSMIIQSGLLQVSVADDPNRLKGLSPRSSRHSSMFAPSSPVPSNLTDFITNPADAQMIGSQPGPGAYSPGHARKSSEIDASVICADEFIDAAKRRSQRQSLIPRLVVIQANEVARSETPILSPSSDITAVTASEFPTMAGELHNAMGPDKGIDMSITRAVPSSRFAAHPSATIGQ